VGDGVVGRGAGPGAGAEAGVGRRRAEAEVVGAAQKERLKWPRRRKSKG
jgi:hypothetical protein